MTAMVSLLWGLYLNGVIFVNQTNLCPILSFCGREKEWQKKKERKIDINM